MINSVFIKTPLQLTRVVATRHIDRACMIAPPRRGCLWIKALSLSILISFPVQAATYNSNGSASDTQAQINAAANGDTVLLPASGSFTWSSSVTLPSSKFITLDLNGRTITLTSGAKLTINAHATGNNRVTNGSIVRGDSSDQYNGVMAINDQRGAAAVIVDNITFSGQQNTLVSAGGKGPGLIHHCTFTGLGWAQEFIHIDGWGAENTTGWTNDSGASLAGSPNMLYIEDCTFVQNTSKSGVAWIQGYYGARVCIRYNSFNWVSVDMHGTAGMVGARWWECYNNTFTNDTPYGQPGWAFSFRAGSGVIFNNSMAPGAGHAVGIGLCEEDSGIPGELPDREGAESSP